MLNVLIRIGMGLVGLVMLLDVIFPQAIESATVDQHTVLTKRGDSRSADLTETKYTLRFFFFGSRIESCEVGMNAYKAAQDGEAITVRYSRIFKRCTSIEKGGSSIYASRAWRFSFVFGGVLFILAALGVFPSLEFEGRRIY